MSVFIIFTYMHNPDRISWRILCCYRYESWIEDGEGRSATVKFQKKHWFDTDITIAWLKWLKSQYPNKKVGLIWDHAPAHVNSKITEFLEVNTNWLKCCLIPGGLTSVMQVCDLIINKALKQIFRDLYYIWRAGHVKEQRNAGVIGRLKLKIPRDVLIDIIEKTIKKMNQQQRIKPTIREMFQKAGQDPFVDCSEKFCTHLDSLSQDSMYKSIIRNQTAVELE